MISEMPLWNRQGLERLPFRFNESKGGGDDGYILKGKGGSNGSKGDDDDDGYLSNVS
jgi:hypothetical protein